jgi:hypothetical protein
MFVVAEAKASKGWGSHVAQLMPELLLGLDMPPLQPAISGGVGAA